MTLSADGSYALVFIVTFLLVSALTLVMCKIFDDTADVVINSSSAAPPFPDAYPQLPAAAAAPMQPTQCVNYCTNFDTGKLEPCYTTKLKQCGSDMDCTTCDSALPYQDIKCLPASTWPSVAEAQAKLDNKSDTYCLPNRPSCIFVPKNADGSDPTPVVCASDDDCLRCTDQLPSGDAFTCQVVAPNTSLTMTNADGKSQEYLALPGGKYCLPTTRGCDPKYGTATWTSNEGWKCICKYPNVFGGDMCNELIACRNFEVEDWAKDKQLLLQNMPGKDGTRVGDAWTLDSGIDPNKCVDVNNNQVARESNGSCPTGTQPAVACQCDGIQKGTRTTYRNVTNDPIACELDPCFANVNGGRTADDVSTLPKIPYQPANVCACSGAGSRLWEYSALATDTYTETGGYKWIGYCKDKTLPGTKITIKASPTSLCESKPNMEANVSGLVQGQRPPPPDMSTTAKSVDSCVADPCAGNYSDPLYRTTQSIGHFDATSGVCACFKDGSPVAAMASNDFPNCDRTINPVCSSCQDACQGASIDELCPVYPNIDKSACGNRRCATLPDGKRTCDCGTDCFFYGGMCYPKVPDTQRCEGLKGVANVCQNEGKHCMLVNSYKYPACDPNQKPVVDRATVCASRDYCGQLTCQVGCDTTPFGSSVSIPLYMANENLMFRKWEACGGKSQARFPEEGLNLVA